MKQLSCYKHEVITPKKQFNEISLNFLYECVFTFCVDKKFFNKNLE